MFLYLKPFIYFLLIKLNHFKIQFYKKKICRKRKYKHKIKNKIMVVLKLSSNDSLFIIIKNRFLVFKFSPKVKYRISYELPMVIIAVISKKYI